MTQSAHIPLIEAGYEQRIIDFAKKCLDDIPACAEADYSVKWVKDANLGGAVVPMLVIAFHLPGISHQPAVGIGLVTVRKGTLLDVLPGKTLQEGDKLRSHILRSVDDYLNKHGIRLSLEPTG